ncbi:NupC/NupG family nucleoside CNT transporter [Fusobacterium necrophorum]|uniref:Nucleoside transporter n=1 Tax=Fusobacterium necrophorum DJ-2 TaxID=1441737 RepID=A0AB73C513_9FUSO|nr:nucleoside transporter C-terminal domain-containing protein [Fusobacterium necrophorum]KDE67668.1 nucleoside transporter [Fusobacterium necrophorum DJ-1]KDE73340.1 nucleoside transporter [Fusobacterium necrophorum DJ-2]MBR8822176.1 putative nucleoside permease NupX [Fusobacterium necrophorum]
MKIAMNILGIVLIFICMYAISKHRKEVKKEIILKAIAVQFIIAFLLVKFPLGKLVVSKVSEGVTKILDYGKDGIAFVFGSLGFANAPTGFIFAIQVLGNIIFLSSLVGALYYLGVLSFIVKMIGKGIGKLLGTSQVETFVAVANMFLGQTESPILVSKYLGMMTESEMMVVLVSGMGSMSATIIGGYVALGIPMEYLLIASTLVPMGSIAISKIIYPEIEIAKEITDVSMDNKGNNENLIGAVTEGAMNGMHSALAIGASLIAVIGLVALVNGLLGVIGENMGVGVLKLENIFAYLFSPLGFLMGLSGNDIFLAGELLGSKLVLNEFVAFQRLGTIIQGLEYRTALILSISLAGFANISSMGICIAGISALCPEKRGILSRLVFRAMIGGFVVSVLSAMIVGLITMF